MGELTITFREKADDGSDIAASYPLDGEQTAAMLRGEHFQVAPELSDYEIEPDGTLKKIYRG